MRTALVILLVCAAVDLIFCALLLAVVWVEHRRQQKRAEHAGKPIPSASTEFGCLVACVLLGLIVLYGAAWFLFTA
jgi:hypothetical protein